MKFSLGLEVKEWNMITNALAKEEGALKDLRDNIFNGVQQQINSSMAQQEVVSDIVDDKGILEKEETQSLDEILGE